MPDTVLITGARATAAIDIARDFRAAGWDVHLADCSPATMARWARCGTVHHYPSPVLEPDAFAAAMPVLADRIGASLIIPACEEIFHLARPSTVAMLAGRLFAPPLPLLRQLHDKLAFARACAQWELPVPETHAIDVADDLTPFAPDSRAWVFKPRFSRFGEAALIGPNAADLAALPLAPGGGWITQQRVLGDDASFYAVAHGGKISAFAAYRSGWRSRGGAAYAFEPLSPDLGARLHDFASRLAGATQLTGQFACDVRIDDAGSPWLIECNPRATSGVHLLAGHGALAGAMTHLPQHAAVNTGGGAYLSLAMLLMGLPHAVSTGQLRAWRQSIAAGEDVLMRGRSFGALAGALIDSGRFALSARRHNISLSGAMTRDIEWNGDDLI